MTLEDTDKNYIQQYKKISNFLIGLEVSTKLEDNNQEIRVKAGENENYWIRFLYFKNKKEVPWERDSYNIFSVYLNKSKLQVVVKANILWSVFQNEKTFIVNRLTEKFNEEGFTKIKFDFKFLPGNMHFPYTTFKVVVDDGSLKGILKIYEIVKDYNSILHPKWIQNKTY